MIHKPSYLPPLTSHQVSTLDDAIAFTNTSKYGNGCAIFTGSGAAARKFQYEIDVGQVTIFSPNKSLCIHNTAFSRFILTPTALIDLSTAY